MDEYEKIEEQLLHEHIVNATLTSSALVLNMIGGKTVNIYVENRPGYDDADLKVEIS